MATTQLSLIATPGKRYSFIAKTAAVVAAAVTYVFGQKKQRVSVVLYEEFTGDGSDTTFQLTSSPDNATWLSTHGAWAADNIHTTYPAHITKTNKKPIYDSIIPLTRNRISVSSISSTGLVTLSHAPRNTIDFYIWYWYQLTTDDILSAYYREDFIALMEGEMIGTVSLYDTDSSNVLTLGWNEDSSNDRTLNLAGLVGGDRTFTINENLTVGDGYAGTLTFSAASKVLTVDESASMSDFVREADFDADTFLYASSDNTPVATSPANVMAALSGHAAAAFDFNSQNLTGAIYEDIYVDGTDRDVFIANSTYPVIYRVGTNIGSYPFDFGGHGHLIIQPRTSDERDIVFATYNGVAVGIRMTIDSGGDVDITDHDAATVGLKLGGTLVTAPAVGLNMNVASGQITFPAAQNASADVNTLDDYEEGTWTPTAADAASGGNTTTTGLGYYTKIGNRVFINGTITNISTVGLTGGNIFYIQGLPFVAGASYSQGSLWTDSVTFDGYCQVQRSEATSSLSVKVSKTGVADVNLLVSSISNGVSDILFSLVYQV